MQLRLIRFDLLILLLVILIHVEALERLSRVTALAPKPIAMPFQRVGSSSWVNDGEVLGSPEISGFLARIDPESRGTHRHRDTRKGRGGKNVTKMSAFSPNNSATLLAEKLAHDALRSKEMQDTIKELTSLNGEHKKHHEITTEAEQVFQPTATTHSTTHAAKTTTKSKGRGRHKGQPNRKHNTHRKQGRKQRLPKRRLKRHRSKKEFSKTARETKSRKSISRGRRRGLKEKRNSEKSVTSRRKRSDQIAKRRENLSQGMEVNLKEPLIHEGQDSIDDPTNFESTHKKYKQILIPRQNEKKTSSVHRKRSHIIAQLMLTTTPDPNKKKPGDQGVEYSEYYSDNDNILIPDIGTSSKLQEAVKTVMGGKVRSARNAADEDPLDQEYYDLSNELEEDAERLKRNNEKFVRVMQQPSNSMEYVDNTYGPVQANVITHNEKMPDYLPNYNYIFDQNAQSQRDANQALRNLPVEVAGSRPPTFNQFPLDPLHIVNTNPGVIGSPQNKAPSNIIPSMSFRFNANPMMNNVPPIASGHPGVFGNDVLSQLPRPRFNEGNLPHSLVNEIPIAHSTNLSASPVAFSTSTLPGKPIKDLSDIRVSVPDSKKLLKLYVATSGVPISSLSDFNPTPPYQSSGANSRVFGSESPGRVTSVPSSSSKASMATFKVAFSPADSVSSASLDSPKLLSGLRDIRPELSAPEVSHFSDDEEAENTQSPEQIEPIESRDIEVESSTVKKGKKKGSTTLKKTSVKTSTTVSQMHDTKEQVSSKATKGVDYNLLPMMTCQTSTTTGASTMKPENATVIANTTVIANNTTVIANNTTVIANTTAVIAKGTTIANTTVTINETKAIANEILNEIIDEIEVLRLENPKDEQREGLPCRLTGSWVTARAGVRIDMKVTNHSVQVSLDHLTSPTTTDALLNVTWNVTGFAPFKRGGPFTLLATNNHTKTLAVFVGACKVCQGIDTIEGSWVVSHEPRDCRDFQMSTNVFNEIFRRTRLYSAIKDKQSKHETQAPNTTSTSAASASSSTSESTSTVQAAVSADHSEKFNNQSSELNGTE